MFNVPICKTEENIIILKKVWYILTGNIIFFLFINVERELWGNLDIPINNIQKKPSKTIITINWEPKLDGKLLLTGIPKFVPWRELIPLWEPYPQLINETNWIF